MHTLFENSPHESPKSNLKIAIYFSKKKPRAFSGELKGHQSESNSKKKIVLTWPPNGGICPPSTVLNITF